jgi:DNA repair photolyase
MIVPYFGEFLFVPYPLEMSMNPCSHKCAYCFSRLNNYKRKSNMNSIVKFLGDYQKRKTFVAQLMKEKNVICISNRSDPFSNNNYMETIQLLKTMTELDIDFYLQTKCGKGIDQVLEFIKPCFWYISITTDNDGFSKKIEPGAPTPTERFEFIKKIVSKGHQVIVAINPYNPEWIKDENAFVKRIKDSGAYASFVSMMHFSGFQRGRQTAKEKEITKLPKKKDVIERMFDLYDIVDSHGLELERFTQGKKTGIYDRQYERYNMFPIMSNFVNWCNDNKKENEFVTFDDFLTGIGGDLHERKTKVPIRDYFFRDIRRVSIPNYGTWLDALKIIWNDFDNSRNPLSWDCFSFVVEEWDEDKNDAVHTIHDNKWGFPMLYFKKDGFKHKFVWENGKEVND